MTSRHISAGEQETLEIAKSFARTLAPGTVVALYGDLGAGKTVFVRGVAGALGAREQVTSPTFTLIHEYRGNLPLYHMDLYRLNSTREIVEIGVEEYFYGDGVCLVEWAEKLGELLPDDVIRVVIRHMDEHHREITIKTPGTEGRNRE